MEIYANEPEVAVDDYIRGRHWGDAERVLLTNGLYDAVDRLLKVCSVFEHSSLYVCSISFSLRN